MRLVTCSHTQLIYRILRIEIQSCCCILDAFVVHVVGRYRHNFRFVDDNSNTEFPALSTIQWLENTRKSPEPEQLCISYSYPVSQSCVPLTLLGVAQCSRSAMKNRCSHSALRKQCWKIVFETILRSIEPRSIISTVRMDFFNCFASCWDFVKDHPFILLSVFFFFSFPFFFNFSLFTIYLVSRSFWFWSMYDEMCRVIGEKAYGVQTWVVQSSFSANKETITR